MNWSIQGVTNLDIGFMMAKNATNPGLAVSDSKIQHQKRNNKPSFL